MQISVLRTTVNRGLLDFAWGQWSQLGVSASVTGADLWAADPEALILFTLGIAHWDPRLFDEVLDWVALNQKLLSIQRLRNLTARFPIDANLVAAVVAWTREPVPTDVLVNEERPVKVRPKVNQTKRPVFSPDVLGFVSKADPIFAEYGFISPSLLGAESPANRTWGVPGGGSCGAAGGAACTRWTTCCSEAALLRPSQKAENSVGRCLRPILHQEVLCPGNGAALDLTGYLRDRSVREIAEALRGRER
jgi:hypothetical protein